MKRDSTKELTEVRCTIMKIWNVSEKILIE